MSQKQSARKAPPSFTVTEEWEGKRLDAITRSAFELSWGRARNWISRGKVFVDDEPISKDGYTPAVGSVVSLRIDTPRYKPKEHIGDDAFVFVDQHLMIIRKPQDLLTVPFEKDDKNTLVQQLRDRLASTAKKKALTGKRKKSAMSLYVVHRLDRATSGLIAFARTISARQGLQEQFREHTIVRRYVALVHGHVKAQTFRSHLVPDRGDGMRGSREQSRSKRIKQSNRGKVAITHIDVLEQFENATLIECRLETGRTNQIRIHLSEAGHPLVGEKVYMRGFREERIVASRLMLHAAELGFLHPATGEELHFEEPLPEPMTRLIRKLRKEHKQKAEVSQE